MSANRPEPPKVGSLPTPPADDEQDSNPPPRIGQGSTRSSSGRSRAERMAGNDDTPDTTQQQPPPSRKRAQPSGGTAAAGDEDLDLLDPTSTKTTTVTMRMRLPHHDRFTGLRRALTAKYGVPTRLVDEAIVTLLWEHRAELQDTVSRFENPNSAVDIDKYLP